MTVVMIPNGSTTPTERHYDGDVFIAAVCKRCNRLTPADMLKRHTLSRDGYKALCTNCARLDKIAARRLFARRTDAECDAAFDRMRPSGKRCRVCRVTRPKEEFWRKVAQPDGRNPACNRCAMQQLLKIALPSWQARGLHECQGCLEPISPKMELHVDHMVPRALGGTDNPNNLQPLCGDCNRRKGAKPYDVWLTEVTRSRTA